MNPKRLKTVIVAGFALLLAAACEENPIEQKKTPPTLPPAKSMSVDVSVFTQKPSLFKEALDSTQTNFTNAAVRVAVINTVVLLALAAPTATFAAAASQNPTLESDGKFHWVYQAQHGLYTYQADLAGWLDAKNSRIKWEMRVTVPSSMPPLNDYLWYDGWSNLTNTEGQWHFYDATKPSGQSEVIRLDWSYSNLLDRRATFTNVSSNPDFNGDVLAYEVAGTACSISFYDHSEDITAVIGWDAVTTAGYIEVPLYHDGEAAYWDENHYDLN